MARFTRFFIKIMLGIIFFLILATITWCYFVEGFHFEKETDLGMQKRNATWMAHEWVGEYQSRGRIHSLLTELMSNNISLVFLHSGPIEQDGSIPYEKYKYAEKFLKMASEIAPDIEFHAWLGQKRKKLAIQDPFIRKKLVDEATHMVEEVGFSGIHLNIEPMAGDEDFLALVRELNMAFSKNYENADGNQPEAEISIAITPIVPKFERSLLKLVLEDSTFLGYDLEKTYNDISYVKSLAQEADYVVLMGYDTGFQNSGLYKWFLEQELIFLMKAAPGRAMLGLPTYEDDRPNFNPEVENIENALAGVRSGLANIRTKVDNLVGLALYARWTTQPKEWSTWREEWLGEEDDS
ncbi:glycoside hydrolase family 18 protein [Candidatus Peregrinibacteria bacterium]|nr:glycoside hydrolase family 18 protein [Candidatus Peregrinibacteria bacterium]